MKSKKKCDCCGVFAKQVEVYKIKSEDFYLCLECSERIKKEVKDIQMKIINEKKEENKND